MVTNDEGANLDLTVDDLFYGESIYFDFGVFGWSFTARECQMCGALVANEALHLKFHRNSVAPNGFEPGNHDPAWPTSGRWTD